VIYVLSPGQPLGAYGAVTVIVCTGSVQSVPLIVSTFVEPPL